MDTSWYILHFLHFVWTRHGVSSLATRFTMLLHHKSNEFSIQSTIFTNKM